MPEDGGALEIIGGLALWRAITAWRATKNFTDGMNSQNRSHPTPAQQQSAAQQGAQQGLSSSSTTNNCPNCGNPKCKELRNEIHQKIYGEKGDGSEYKGILQRREEQLRGQYGPGKAKMSVFFNKKTGRNQIFDTIPWDTHYDEIQKLQNSIKELRDQYRKEKCSGDPDAKLNDDMVDRVLKDDFNPGPKAPTGTPIAPKVPKE